MRKTMSSKKTIGTEPKKPLRAVRRDEIVDLLRDLAERPALNGGFAKLSQMQEEQCRDITALKKGMSELKDDVGHLKSLVKWGKRAMWAIFMAAGSTMLKLVFEVIGNHISIH